MSETIVHLDLIAIASEVAPDARRELTDAAGGLLALPGVLGGGAIEGEAGSDFDLALYYALADYAALEPFGTDPRYARFLQGSVGPLLGTFAGADVRLEGSLPPPSTYAACLTLAAGAETYDWEVRQRLADWAGDRGAAAAAIGLAAGERQRYRGLAIVFADAAIEGGRPAPDGFEIAWIAGRARSLS